MQIKKSSDISAQVIRFFERTVQKNRFAEMSRTSRL